MHKIEYQVIAKLSGKDLASNFENSVKTVNWTHGTKKKHFYNSNAMSLKKIFIVIIYLL